MSTKLYALSTCAWCRKTKRLLDELGVDYESIDVDLLDGEEKEKAREEVAKANPRRSYPTIVCDGGEVIIGFNEEKIRTVLGK